MRSVVATLDETLTLARKSALRLEALLARRQKVIARLRVLPPKAPEREALLANERQLTRETAALIQSLAELMPPELTADEAMSPDGDV